MLSVECFPNPSKLAGPEAGVPYTACCPAPSWPSPSRSIRISRGSVVGSRVGRRLIHCLMRAEVDQDQNFRAGFRMLLLGKHNPAIVSDGTGMESGQLAAQVVGLQARIVKVCRHAAQGVFDGGLQRGIFSGQPTKRPLKLWC